MIRLKLLFGLRLVYLSSLSNLRYLGNRTFTLRHKKQRRRETRDLLEEAWSISAKLGDYLNAFKIF